MLETDDKLMACIVIYDGGAGAVEIRRRGDAGRAFDLLAVIGGKRRAAAPASGIRDEMHSPPRFRAQHAGGGDVLLGHRTVRRHGEIDHAARAERRPVPDSVEDLRFHMK